MADSFSDVLAVLPAAGNGSRMQAQCPKQYLRIGDKTILEHAVACLTANPRIKQIIIVTSPADRWFADLPLAHNPDISVVTGGNQRADSVLAGLTAAGAARWVLVHDAARPCLHQDDLSRLLAITQTSKVGGILAAPVSDTMKRAEPGKSVIAHTVEREALWRAMTPQLFPLELLRSCLLRARQAGVAITDEAAALEYCGFHPELINGRADNIKVTHPEDLALAEFYLNRLAQMENQ